MYTGLVVLWTVVALIVIVLFTLASCLLCRRCAVLRYRFNIFRAFTSSSSSLIGSQDGPHLHQHFFPENAFNLMLEQEALQEQLELSSDLDTVETFWEHSGDESVQASAAASAKLTERLYLLAATKFISNLDAKTFAALYAHIEWMHLNAEEILFSQGDDSADGMYIVVKGTMGLYRHIAGQGLVKMSHLVRGESFGEFALLTGERRFFTCRAVTDCQLIKIPRAVYAAFIGDRPAAFVSFVQTNVVRQWRMAHFVLHEFFQLPQQHQAVLIASPASSTSSPSSESPSSVDSPSTSSSTSSSPSSSSSCNISMQPSAFTSLRFDPSDPLFEQLQQQTEQLQFAPGEIVFRAGFRPRDKIYVLLSGKMVAYSNNGSSASAESSIASSSSSVTISPAKSSASFSTSSSSLSSEPSSSDTSTTSSTSSSAGSQHSTHRYLSVGEVLGGLCPLTATPFGDEVRCLSAVRVAVITSQHVHQPQPPQFVVQLFEGLVRLLQPTVCRFVEAGCQRVVMRGGQFVYRAGTPAAEMFVITKGRLRMVIEAGRGECVGEQSLCAGMSHHSSSFVCVRDSELVKLSRAAFHVLMRAHPQALLKLSQIMARRLSAMSAKDTQRRAHSRFANISTIALFPTSSQIDTSLVARQLADKLSVHGRTKRVDRQTILESFAHDVMMQPPPADANLDLGNAAQVGGSGSSTKPSSPSSSSSSSSSAHLEHYYYRSKMTSWLTEQEEENRFLILEADHENSSWSKSVIRQADVVLLLCDDAQDPLPSAIEQLLIWPHTIAASFASSSSSSASASASSAPASSSRPRPALQMVELVMLHRDDCAFPSKTREFLDARPPQLHSFHHVRDTCAADFERLARYFSGRSVGLVLSGGGARGLAHLGAIRAMEEAGLPIDYIGGTSQGSFMGALYAKHLSARAMEAPTRLLAVRMGSIWDLLRDLTYPMMSWFSGASLSRCLRDFFGDAQIEDLWIPYFCVTTNITRADVCIHRRGDLWRSIRSSMSILQFLPPMPWAHTNGKGSDILIDGGYCSNLPADIMADIHAPQLLVGIDIENKDGDRFVNVELPDDVSGWWLVRQRLWSWLNPFAKPFKMPYFGEFVSTLSFINHNRNTRRMLDDRVMDIYVRPELGTAALLDYHRMDEIVQIGYNASKEVIAAWLIENPQQHPAVSLINHSGTTGVGIQDSSSAAVAAAAAKLLARNNSKFMVSSAASMVKRSRSLTDLYSLSLRSEGAIRPPSAAPPSTLSTSSSASPTPVKPSSGAAGSSQVMQSSSMEWPQMSTSSSKSSLTQPVWRA